MKPNISIIVPVYNAEKYLRQCLDSLVHQSMKNIEIICINDGSVDNSLQILEEYSKRDNRIRIVNQENKGVSFARNAGIALLHGEYFMFVDSDDWIDLNTCETMYDTVKKYDADCAMFSYVKEFFNHSVICSIWDEREIIWNKQAVQEHLYRRLFGPIEEELEHPEKMDILVSSCMQLFRASKYANIPFYDILSIGTFEDGLYQIDIYSDCNCFVFENNPFYHYRKTNDESITTVYKSNFVEKWIALFNLIDKKILDNNLGTIYREALQNRISLSLIGLGLNEVREKDNVFSKARRIKNILNNQIFRDAVEKLNFAYIPTHWKVFFFLCKYRASLLVTMMLEIIEFLRKRVK